MKFPSNLYNSDEIVQEIVPRFASKVLPIALRVMAVLLCAYGVYELYSLAIDNMNFYWFRPLEALAFIVCGSMILLDRRRKYVRSVGFYAIAMGISRVLSSLPYMQDIDDIGEMFFIEELIARGFPVAIVGVVFLAIGMNTLLSGAMFLTGTARGKHSMQISAVVMSLLYIEMIVFLLKSGYPYDYLLEYETFVFIRILMYFFLVWLLDTREIRYGDKVSKHFQFMSAIDNTYRSRDVLSISEEDASVLCAGPSSDGWYTLDDGGPVEKEFRFTSTSIAGDTFVTVQKWKGSDRLYFMLSAYDSGTVVYADRFSIDKVFLNGPDMAGSDTVRMLGPEKLYVQIGISRPEPEVE
ncbi:MAG: hypothetical protein MJZ68_06210 [archaeon]|nr:hypothetical protein [archaeon]